MQIKNLPNISKKCYAVVIKPYVLTGSQQIHLGRGGLLPSNGLGLLAANWPCIIQMPSLW